MDDQREMPVPTQMPPGPPPPGEPEDEETQVQRDAGLFVQFLEADPMAQTYIDRTLRYHLEGGVSLETWGRIVTGLTLYAGENVALFLLTVLLRSDDTDFLARVERHVGVEVWSHLRGLMALYGDAVREANLISGENPQGWRTIDRRVYYDHLTNMWRATFELTKYNGEQVHLDETPTTAIVLCSGILHALNSVPAQDAPQVADRRAVEDLASQAYTFIQLFAPDLLKEDKESTLAKV